MRTRKQTKNQTGRKTRRPREKIKRKERNKRKEKKDMWKINGQIFPSTNEIKEEKKAKSRKYDKHKREVKNWIKKQKEKMKIGRGNKVY